MKIETEKREAKASSPIPIGRRLALYITRDRQSSFGNILYCVPKNWTESGATMEASSFRKLVLLLLCGGTGFFLIGLGNLWELRWSPPDTTRTITAAICILFGTFALISLPFVTLGQLHKEFIIDPRKKYDPEDLRRGLRWLPVGIAVIAVIKEFDLVKDWFLSLFGQ